MGNNHAKNMPLPLPTKEATHLVQADVNEELYSAVQKELKARKVKIRQVVEWALCNYLLATNPEEAKRLGITSELK